MNLFQWKDSQLQYASMSQVVRQNLKKMNRFKQVEQTQPNIAVKGMSAMKQSHNCCHLLEASGPR